MLNEKQQNAGKGVFKVGNINNPYLNTVNGGEKGNLSYIDIVNRMTDLAALAFPVSPGETCNESSAYNKKSRYNEETGHYENWGENFDEGYDAPRAADGGYIIAEMKGPGSIVRIWSADPRQGHIKIFIDGSDNPSVDIPFIDLFGTGAFPFNLKELCYEAGRGKNCYVPISYNESCKVVLYDDWGMFYQVNYISFAEDKNLESFRLPFTIEQANALKSVNDKFALSVPASPKHNNHAKTLKNTVFIPSGGCADLLNTELPGAITEIKIKIKGLHDDASDWKALAELSLSAYWDKEEPPAVWSTLGGFFGSITGLNEYHSLPLGVNADGTMYSRWYMPYSNGAKITIGNDGKETYHITYEITYVPLEKEVADRFMRFHAKWNRATDPPPGERWPDSQFLYTSGAGRYVGTSLHIYKEIGTGDPAYEPDWWWGEGDEKFFVDGEKFPSWFGTGSEDYFGYAWGTWETFSRPYHSQPFTNGGMFGIGNRLNNRFHIIDNIPFNQSFDANLEKYHRDRYANWVFTNYWYLKRGGCDSYQPVSLEERTAYYEHPYPAAADFYEGQDLKIIESAGMIQAETQDMSGFSTDVWSHNAQFILKAHKAGDYVKFWIRVLDPAEYMLILRLTKAIDFGIARHYIDGKPIGNQIDLYSDTLTCIEISLGTVHMESGLHVFEARLEGKSIHSSGYYYGMDYLKVNKTDTGAQSICSE